LGGTGCSVRYSKAPFQGVIAHWTFLPFRTPGFLTCGLHNRETCALRFHLGSDRGLVGHTLPYLVPDTWNNAFWIATSIAGLVVFFELWAIAFVRHKYMSTPFTQAVLQIVLGGSIVLAAGILIGGS
jgi:hypothetical protein